MFSDDDRDVQAMRWVCSDCSMNNLYGKRVHVEFVLTLFMMWGMLCGRTLVHGILKLR